MEKIQMDILGLSTSPSSGGAYALILNETTGKRRLPIIIGTFEAQAIALELEHIKPPRPMTHDLLRNIVQSFSTYVKQVFINELREGTFYAEIIYDFNGRDIHMDARPSDAIALAIRFNAPIFVSDDVLDEAGIMAESVEEDLEEASQTEEETEEISSLRDTDELNKLKILEKNLESAIEKEDYEKAAKIRDEIKKLKG
ncbi:MAG TPA: bifunctional nuclease domain-containing protein [Balneolales bacterium]|nr:bifunctional nuclease domain-containing protein [Balneolales bacterium]